MPNTATELSINNINKNLKLIYIKPEIDIEVELSHFKELCDRKIIVYRDLENAHNISYSTLAKRAHKKLNQKVLKVDYIMSVIVALIQTSPQSFQLFNMESWRIFIKTIFEVLPTYPRLMNTFGNIEELHMKSNLSESHCPKQVVGMLIENNADTIDVIRSDYYDYLKKYNEAHQLLLFKANNIIKQIKEDREN